MHLQRSNVILPRVALVSCHWVYWYRQLAIRNAIIEHDEMNIFIYSLRILVFWFPAHIYLRISGKSIIFTIKQISFVFRSLFSHLFLFSWKSNDWKFPHLNNSINKHRMSKLRDQFFVHFWKSVQFFTIFVSCQLKIESIFYTFRFNACPFTIYLPAFQP